MLSTPPTSRMARAIHEGMHAAVIAVIRAHVAPSETWANTAVWNEPNSSPGAIQAPTIIVPTQMAEIARLAAIRIRSRASREVSGAGSEESRLSSLRRNGGAHAPLPISFAVGPPVSGRGAAKIAIQPHNL